MYQLCIHSSIDGHPIWFNFNISFGSHTHAFLLNTLKWSCWVIACVLFGCWWLCSDLIMVLICTFLITNVCTYLLIYFCFIYLLNILFYQVTGQVPWSFLYWISFYWVVGILYISSPPPPPPHPPAPPQFVW